MKYALLIFLNCACIKLMSQNQIYISAYKNIYVVDPYECTAVLKGTAKLFWDIAFTSDGRLWGIDPEGSIYQIDTSTIDTTFTLSTELHSSSLEGFNDSTILAVSDQSLYKININSGVVTLLGNIGYKPSGDIVWYDNSLYLNSDYLIRIELDLSVGTVLDVEQITSFKYDGMDGWAMGVSAANDSTNILFVFDNYNLFQVCQIDGSTQLQCPSLLPFFAYGAASAKLPVQNPEPTYCRTMIDVNNNEIQYLVNPIDEFITIYSTIVFENINVNLFDATGQLVRASSGLNGTEFSFSTQNLAPGLYILQIESGTEAQAHKLLLY